MRGLPPPDPRLSCARSVARSPARLPRHSAPLSRPGWAGLHHRDITSIRGAPPGPAVLQVLAILTSNKARPALPPPTHLQAQPPCTFGLGREIRVSGQTDEWVVAVYCHAPTVPCSRLERGTHRDTKFVFVTASAPPCLASLHTWTQHTRSVHLFRA